MRAMNRIDLQALRGAFSEDLMDSSVWQAAATELERRLAAARGRGGVESSMSIVLGSSCSAGEAMRHVEHATSLTSTTGIIDANRIPFPLVVGTEPEELRADLHYQYDVDGVGPSNLAFSCDPAVEGEAAWRCVLPDRVRTDVTTLTQELVAERRSLRLRLSEARLGARLTRLGVVSSSSLAVVVSRSHSHARIACRQRLLWHRFYCADSLVQNMAYFHDRQECLEK